MIRKHNFINSSLIDDYSVHCMYVYLVCMCSLTGREPNKARRHPFLDELRDINITFSFATRANDAAHFAPRIQVKTQCECVSHMLGDAEESISSQ